MVSEIENSIKNPAKKVFLALDCEKYNKTNNGKIIPLLMVCKPSNLNKTLKIYPIASIAILKDSI